MAYEKLNLADGDVLKAEHLAHMEEGIKAASVQPDWNQTDETAADFIRNKPFGETVVQGDTLTWDGNTEGLVCIAEGLYKISDAVPTVEDMQKGGKVVAQGETIPWGEGEFPADDVVFPDGIISLLGAGIIVPPEMAGVTSEVVGLAFPEAGIWVAMPLELQLNGYEDFVSVQISTISEKYLPAIPVQKLPGYVFLYHDDENYLYADSDTSDTSKRITRQQLKAIFEQGQPIMLFDGAFSFYAPTFIHTGSDGTGYGWLTTYGVGGWTQYYTAEYTPST